MQRRAIWPEARSEVMAEENLVTIYARHKGWEIGSCNVLVEGVTDYELLSATAEKHRAETREDLCSGGLRFLYAGHKHEGGTHGVVRELTVTRSLAKYSLTPQGVRQYRFVGLVDNDAAGRQAIENARAADASVVEFRDIMRIRPNMICGGGNVELESLRAEFERRNSAFGRLDWELEDLLAVDFVESFCTRVSGSLLERQEVAGRVHWELTRKGKRELIRFAKENATLDELRGVIRVIRSLRFCLGLDVTER